MFTSEFQFTGWDNTSLIVNEVIQNDMSLSDWTVLAIVILRHLHLYVEIELQFIHTLMLLTCLLMFSGTTNNSQGNN